jgi:hypothetical protein
MHVAAPWAWRRRDQVLGALAGPVATVGLFALSWALLLATPPALRAAPSALGLAASLPTALSFVLLAGLAGMRGARAWAAGSLGYGGAGLALLVALARLAGVPIEPSLSGLLLTSLVWPTFLVWSQGCAAGVWWGCGY